MSGGIAEGWLLTLGLLVEGLSSRVLTSSKTMPCTCAAFGLERQRNDKKTLQLPTSNL